MATAFPPARIDALQRELGAAVRRRQEFRERGAGPLALEANRLAIVRLQQELNHAAIRRYAPRAHERAAA